MLVKTIEKTSFWKDESTLAFPLLFIFSILLILCSLSVCCLFCYKRGLKMTKSESCWVKSFCTVWGEVTPWSDAISTVHSFFFFSVNHLLYSLACPCPRREWIKKINFYSLIPMSCKINPCSFISLYLDEYQIKYFWKMKMPKIFVW